MCLATRNAFACFIFTLLSLQKCTSLSPQPSLVLFSPNETEYTEVIVRQLNDNLTLVCERRGSDVPQRYVWNYLPQTDSPISLPLLATPAGLARSSKYVKLSLQLKDSGHYICSVPPHSVTKYLLVQPKGPPHCSRVAFWCGSRCVLPTYVCDGRRDCARGEDEAPALCGAELPCQRADKLNCSSGRCISAAACCAPGEPLCRQPYCCEEHSPDRSRLGYGEVEYPALFEDRHAPDDYGFIQSTIYTVTACALIFMIAVVLLVSAICKMHMKRAALRSYTQQGQQRNLFQSHRFPPCYEASRLLDERARSPHLAGGSQHGSPAHSARCRDPSASSPPASPPLAPLSRLGAVFSSRYRQVPTAPPEVEMQSVRCSSLQSSPTRRLADYRSPTCCDLNTDLYLASPESADCGRDLNYMATPIEFYRRRTLTRNNPIDRLLDQISSERPRPLTLQLGRFQLSLPRFGRRSSTEDRRPDTPNVAEINIDDLDFVRLNSNETYTLNGRTIRLLGANFENYPSALDNRNVVCGPPQYDEAMRFKLYGPPPEYLSRDTLSDDRECTGGVDDEARTNIEMPPSYEDLASGVDSNANNGNTRNVSGNTSNVSSNTSNVSGNTSNVSDNTSNVSGNTSNISDNTSNVPSVEQNAGSVPICDNTSINGNRNTVMSNDNGSNDMSNGNGSMSLTAVMDNLPAIDSDVNANDSTTGINVVYNDINNGNVVVVNDNE